MAAGILFLAVLSGCTGRSSVEYRAFSQSVSAESEAETEQKETETAEEAEAQGEEPAEEIRPVSLYVDVAGAVQKPGVYELAEGSRVFQAVEAAGGFSGNAELRCINQADLLRDGEKIYVYSREEAEQLGGWMQLSGGGQAGQQSGALQSEGSAGGDGRVNINQADKNQLMTLTGVGEARADAIIAYRETNGTFSSVEDIMKVSGIKEKLFEQIKDRITV